DHDQHRVQIDLTSIHPTWAQLRPTCGFWVRIGMSRWCDGKQASVAGMCASSAPAQSASFDQLKVGTFGGALFCGTGGHARVETHFSIVISRGRPCRYLV